MSEKSKAAVERIVAAVRTIAGKRFGELAAGLEERISAARRYADEKADAVTALLADLEARLGERLAALPPGPAGEPGKDAVLPDLEPLVAAAVERLAPGILAGSPGTLEAVHQACQATMAALPAPKDGKDGKDGQDAPAPDLDALVEAVLAKVPRPKDGAPGRDGPTQAQLQEAVADAFRQAFTGPEGAGRSVIQEAVRAAVEALPAAEPGAPGKDGQAAELPDLDALVRPIVQAAVDALPQPERGEPGERGLPGQDAVLPDVEALVAAAVARLPKAQDGAPGQDAALPDVAEMVRAEVAKLPRAKDGEHGRDAAQLAILPGIDEGRSYGRGTYASHRGGLFLARRQTDALAGTELAKSGWEPVVDGVASIVVNLAEDGRTVRVATVMSSGREAVQEVVMKNVLDRGVYKEGTQYAECDGVTYSGSWWVARRATPDKPGTSDAWRLAVKRGQDGKDAKGKADTGPVRIK